MELEIRCSCKLALRVIARFLFFPQRASDILCTKKITLLYASLAYLF